MIKSLIRNPSQSVEVDMMIHVFLSLRFALYLLNWLTIRIRFDERKVQRRTCIEIETIHHDTNFDKKGLCKARRSTRREKRKRDDSTSVFRRLARTLIKTLTRLSHQNANKQQNNFIKFDCTRNDHTWIFFWILWYLQLNLFLIFTARWSPTINCSD